MFSKVFQLFLNTLLRKHVTGVQWLFMRGGNGGSSVRKILAVFFTFIKFHVVPSYEVMAATLAQLWRRVSLKQKEVTGMAEGWFPKLKQGIRHHKKQDLEVLCSGKVGARSWVLLPILNFSSEHSHHMTHVKERGYNPCIHSETGSVLHSNTLKHFS